jgi:hypothetical protein
MKNLNKGAITVTAIVLLFSCKEKKPDMLGTLETKVVAAFSNQDSGQENIKAYVFIPNTGCSGCISSAEQLLVTMLANKYPVRFVLTHVLSLKTLRLKLGDSVAMNPKVYIDKDNSITEMMATLKQVYPMIVYVDHGADHHFIKYEYIEPDNPESAKHMYAYLSQK